MKFLLNNSFDAQTYLGASLGLFLLLWIAKVFEYLLINKFCGIALTLAVTTHFLLLFKWQSQSRTRESITTQLIVAHSLPQFIPFIIDMGFVHQIGWLY